MTAREEAELAITQLRALAGSKRIAAATVKDAEGADYLCALAIKIGAFADEIEADAKRAGVLS